MARLPRWLLYAAAVAVVLTFSKLHAARVGQYDITDSGRLPWIAGYVLVLILCAYGAGLPDGQLTRSTLSAVSTSLGANLAAAVIMSTMQFADGAAHLPRFVVLASAAVLVPTFATITLLATDQGEREEQRARVVAVAAPDDSLALIDELQRDPERRARVVWTMTPEEARGLQPGDVTLVDAAIDTRASIVLLAHEAQADPVVVAQAAALHTRGMRVRSLSDFYDEFLGKLPLGELQQVSLLFDVREVHDGLYARLKRLMDIAGVLVGLPAFALVVPVVWMLNLVGNRGSLFYAQPRVGKDGRVFRIQKFRTMRATGDAPSTWTTDDDPRITPVGKWLRRTHLDEMPQLVNILRGDLSFVGPRPEQPHYVEELAEKIPFYSARHLVRPGLTGWAQVKYSYGASELDAMEKLQYEFYYLRHQSLTFDVRILGRTIRDVLGRAGK